MRFISQDELMRQPPGTIYQEYKEYDLGPPMVFGGPMEENIDYIEADFLPTVTIESVFGGSPFLKEKGLDKPGFLAYYQSGFGRNGYFEKDGVFLLWETEDRKRYAEWLLNPEKLANEVNDDPVWIAKAPD